MDHLFVLFNGICWQWLSIYPLHTTKRWSWMWHYVRVTVRHKIKGNNKIQMLGCLVRIIKRIFLSHKMMEPMVTCCRRCSACCITDNKHDISLANLSLCGTACTLALKSDAAKRSCTLCSCQEDRVQLRSGWGISTPVMGFWATREFQLPSLQWMHEFSSLSLFPKLSFSIMLLPFNS